MNRPGQGFRNVADASFDTFMQSLKMPTTGLKMEEFTT